MRLIDRLIGTYTLTAESVATADGQWQRVLEYSQLPDCRVETFSMPDGLDDLDARRIRTIARMHANKEPIPAPTGSRTVQAVIMELRDLDILSELSPILYEDQESSDDE